MRDRAATWALVLGLLAMWFGIFAPFAIVIASRSLWRIRASRGELRGGTSAVAGLAGGVIGLAVVVGGLAYWVLAS